jgi:hypothetical protein
MLSRSISTCTINDELNGYSSGQGQALHACEPDAVYTNYAANNTKKEQFMKSPLVIYNHCYVKGVIETACSLRQQLELQAKAVHNKGGQYIRPIALFVVDGTNALNDLALHELKVQLIEAGIRESEIKIKGNVVDELQNTDVMKEDCDIRYVITVNDLQEQWRCSFVYIAASLERRAFAMNMLAPVNSLLPQPYSVASADPLLNAGYVLTASSKFSEITATLQSHLHDLGAEISVKDNLVELLKHISIFEILRGEVNNGMEGIDLKKEPTDDRVVNELKGMILGDF